MQISENHASNLLETVSKAYEVYISALELRMRPEYNNNPLMRTVIDQAVVAVVAAETVLRGIKEKAKIKATSIDDVLIHLNNMPRTR